MTAAVLPHQIEACLIHSWLDRLFRTGRRYQQADGRRLGTAATY